MALRFFRERQKLMMVLMVALMFAFALSSVIPSFFQNKPDEFVIGHLGDEEITEGQIRQANTSLSLLRGMPMSLGSFQRPRNHEVAFARFLDLNPSEDDRAFAWTLLTREAARMGAAPGELHVNRLLTDTGLTGKRLEEAVDNLRLSSKGFTRGHLSRAVSEYLAVMDTFAAVAPAALATSPRMPEAPPSTPEMRHACKILNEQVQLLQATFSPEEYLDDVAEPTDEAILTQFKEYKHVAPNSRDNKTEYGFGYRQPDRVRIGWLLVDYEALSQAVEPAENDMLKFWESSGEKMTTWKEAAPDTQPASAPFVPSPAIEVVITDYAEARPLIRKQLIPRTAGDRMSRIVRRAQQIIEDNAGKADPYAATVDALISPADDILAQPVASLPEISATLKEVVDRLAEASGVKIIYPYGEHDNLTLSAELKIKLPKTTAKPLGEILEQIQTQAKYPQIKWVVCDGLPGAIFPVDPVNLAPISVGRTEMLDAGGVFTHDVLRNAWTDAAGGQPIVAIAFTAAEFQRPGGRTAPPLIEVGKDFPQPMYVGPQPMYGAEIRRGRMLWRMLEAKGQYEPKELTDRIREQVTQDLKLLAGLKKATAAAEALAARLGDGDFEKLAKAAKARFRSTPMLPRKSVSQWFQADFLLMDFLQGARYYASRLSEENTAQDFQQAVRNSIYAANLLSQEMVNRPDADVFAPTRFLDVDSELRASSEDLFAANETLTDEAFKLVPADTSRPPTDTPATVVALPRLRRMVVMQRVGYDMPSEDNYAMSINFFNIVGRKPVGLTHLLKAPLRQRAMNSWFKLENIIERTGFEKTGEETVSVESNVTSQPKD